MKTIKFRPALAEMILRGEKTTTFRLFDDKDLKEGDTLELVNWDTKKVFAHAVAQDVYEKTLGSLTEDDWYGHERYADDEELYRTVREYYGDRVGPDAMVKIIRFELC